MGTYWPTPFLTETDWRKSARKILEPFMRGCVEEGIDFRGILYPGVMLTKAGPKFWNSTHASATRKRRFI